MGVHHHRKSRDGSISTSLVKTSSTLIKFSFSLSFFVFAKGFREVVDQDAMQSRGSGLIQDKEDSALRNSWNIFAASLFVRRRTWTVSNKTGT